MWIKPITTPSTTPSGTKFYTQTIPVNLQFSKLYFLQYEANFEGTETVMLAIVLPCWYYMETCVLPYPSFQVQIQRVLDERVRVQGCWLVTTWSWSIYGAVSAQTMRQKNSICMRYSYQEHRWKRNHYKQMDLNLLYLILISGAFLAYAAADFQAYQAICASNFVTILSKTWVYVVLKNLHPSLSPQRTAIAFLTANFSLSLLYYHFVPFSVSLTNEVVTLGVIWVLQYSSEDVMKCQVNMVTGLASDIDGNVFMSRIIANTSHNPGIQIFFIKPLVINLCLCLFSTGNFSLVQLGVINFVRHLIELPIFLLIIYNEGGSHQGLYLTVYLKTIAGYFVDKMLKQWIKVDGIDKVDKVVEIE